MPSRKMMSSHTAALRPYSSRTAGRCPVRTRSQLKALQRALASNVRDARKRMRWTQAEMADRIHVPVEVYGRIERGTLLPGLDTFVDICRVLGEMSDRLLGLPPPRRLRRRR